MTTLKKLIHGSTYPALIFLAAVFLTWTVAGSGRAQDTNPGGIGPKPFIDYFLPIPITGSLSRDVGAQQPSDRVTPRTAWRIPP